MYLYILQVNFPTTSCTWLSNLAVCKFSQGAWLNSAMTSVRLNAATHQKCMQRLWRRSRGRWRRREWNHKDRHVPRSFSIVQLPSYQFQFLRKLLFLDILSLVAPHKLCAHFCLWFAPGRPWGGRLGWDEESSRAGRVQLFYSWTSG